MYCFIVLWNWHSDRVPFLFFFLHFLCNFLQRSLINSFLRIAHNPLCYRVIYLSQERNMLILLNTLLSSLVKFILVSFLIFEKEGCWLIMFLSLLICEGESRESFSLTNCSVIIVSLWLVKELSEFLMKSCIILTFLNYEIVNPVQLFHSWKLIIDLRVSRDSVQSFILNVRIYCLFMLENSELIVFKRLVKVLLVKCSVLIVELWGRNVKSLIPITHIGIGF